MRIAKTFVCTTALLFGALCQGCKKSEEGVVIKATPEFIAQEKAEKAAIEAAREEEGE